MYRNKDSTSSMIDKLIAKTEKLEISKSARFVANPIIYTEGNESDESSDASYDSSDEELFDFDPTEKKDLPFRPFTIKTSKAKKTQGEDVFSTPVGFVRANTQLANITPSHQQSLVVQPFLDNLYNSGLDIDDTTKIEEAVSVSICLNRPLSLSTRKNHLLTKELATTTESPIKHTIFGIFWQFKWFNGNNNEVAYEVVQLFYKKLKRYDDDNGTSKAYEFREACEKGIAVPYQELRELAKDHEHTKQLVKAFRDSHPQDLIYLSIVDGDTQSFNGIYSAYFRILSNATTSPDIMSTGYEFTQEKEGDHPFVEGSKLDRSIRVETAKYLPWCVYYTEPNFCILIQVGQETVVASFIDKRIDLKNAESVALLRNLLSTPNAASFVVVFSDDNPVLTKIPDRVRLTKAGKTPIKFSEEFKNGYAPTLQDIGLYKQMSQSHVHESVWIDNLYINKWINMRNWGTGGHYTFKKLITKYLSSTHTQEDLTQLLVLVPQNIVELIKSAYDAKAKVIKDYQDSNVRVFSTQSLIDYINSEGLDINAFTPAFLAIIANTNILELIEEQILDLFEMSQIPNDILKTILSNGDIIDGLQNGEFKFSDIVKLYNITKEHGDIFDEVLEEFLLVLRDYSVEEILEKYEENPLHLRFMAGDPTDLVLENSDDVDIVKFGIDNYDVDIDWIREQLNEDGDPENLDSASLMEFDRMIGTYEDDYNDDRSFSGEYEDY